MKNCGIRGILPNTESFSKISPSFCNWEGGAEAAINILNKQTMVPWEVLCSVNVQDGVEHILPRTELVM